MSKAITSWALRVGAWLVLLAVVGRLALDSRSAWLNGRIMQMEVLFESRRAEDRLFRELGLGQHLDPARYRIYTPEYCRFKAPVWLQLLERGDTDWDTGGGLYIWLNADGTWVWPPLSDYSIDPNEWVCEPWRIWLPARDGTLIRAALCNTPSQRYRGECLVWIHRSDRWVNVLHMMILDWSLEPVPAESDAITNTFTSWPNPTELRLDWDAATESFIIPSKLPQGVIILPQLPDQVGFRPPPKHRITTGALEPFVDNADLDGLLEHYAAVTIEYGRDVKPTESTLSDMGYQAIELGRIADAITIFKRNIEMYPESPWVHYSLGEAYEQSGDLELALENYQKAVDVDPEKDDPRLSVFEEDLERVKSLLSGDRHP